MNAHLTYRETEALWFMYISPWKTELQAKAYLQLSYALYFSHIKLGEKKF